MTITSQEITEDFVDLREVFFIIWNGKWWLLGITLIFAIFSIYYSLSIPNQYRATAIVAPASQSGNQLGPVSRQLGGLASFAGVSLGDSETSEATIAIELLKTWSFAENFIKNYDLQVPLAGVKGWNFNSEDWFYDDALYDISAKKWIRKAKGKPAKPTSWELYKKYKKGLYLAKDKDSGLITIGFQSYSPEYSQRVTQWLIEEVNKIMKNRALMDASKNINYLEGQIERTPLSDMQKIFYSLIEEQTKTLMLAEVSDEYVFKVVSESLVPEEKSTPRRALICIAITMLGFVFALLVVFIMGVSRK